MSARLSKKPVPNISKFAKSSKTTNASPKAEQALIDRLRKICLALPDAEERVSHGEPTWFAGKGKVFAMLDNHHHGSPHLAVWLPLPVGAQASLVERDGERFFCPPYVGVKGWVGVVLDGKPDWRKVELLIRDAYSHVATRSRIARMAAMGRS